jgi:heme-degrading monooxygenase HmoA
VFEPTNDYARCHPRQEQEERVYVAMNRFRVSAGREGEFEKIWRERESYLDEVPGFREFHLLRGPSEGEATLYVSHSVWNSREAFEAWTRSEAFRKAHAQARSPSGTVLGHPQFEGYEAVL